jgi:multidrug resistance efflux pump
MFDTSLRGTTMRRLYFLLALPLFALQFGCGRHTATAQSRRGEPAPSTANETWEVTGKTIPTPHGIARIANVPIHPVEKVHVYPGKRVKKNDVLIELDRDEPEADVRAKAASLKEMEACLERLKREPRHADHEEARASVDSARINALTSKQFLERLEPLREKGSVPEQRYQEARANKLRYEAEERASRARLERLLKRPLTWELNELQARINTARGNLEAAKADLEHYTIQAPIDGVISWLDVCPGTVSRPGTAVWGEILDLRQIDVRCEVTPQQADRLVKNQRAQVIAGKQKFPGKVVMIGIAADKRTGRVPVLVRIEKANERLRCYVPVKVRFGG